MGPFMRVEGAVDGDMGVSVRVFVFVCLMLALGATANEASARPCGDSDNPMVWDEGFGASQCRAHRPRYDARRPVGNAATDASDPMVWSDKQWGSSLMGGYSRNYDSRYDLRYRRDQAAAHPVRFEKRVEVTILADDAVDLVEESARGPKHLNMRTAGEFKANPGVLRFGGHDCRGVLVLTWGSLGSKSRCHVGDPLRSVR